MTEKNVASAVAYYRAMADKDLTGMARYLHPDVHLISPMEELTGRRRFLQLSSHSSTSSRASKCTRSSVPRTRRC